MGKKFVTDLIADPWTWASNSFEPLTDVKVLENFQNNSSWYGAPLTKNNTVEAIITLAKTIYLENDPSRTVFVNGVHMQVRVPDFKNVLYGGLLKATLSEEYQKVFNPDEDKGKMFVMDVDGKEKAVGVLFGTLDKNNENACLTDVMLAPINYG